jgi:hypothetical protein
MNSDKAMSLVLLLVVTGLVWFILYRMDTCTSLVARFHDDDGSSDDGSDDDSSGDDGSDDDSSDDDGSDDVPHEVLAAEEVDVEQVVEF